MRLLRLNRIGLALTLEVFQDGVLALAGGLRIIGLLATEAEDSGPSLLVLFQGAERKRWTE